MTHRGSFSAPSAPFRSHINSYRPVKPSLPIDLHASTAAARCIERQAASQQCKARPTGTTINQYPTTQDQRYLRRVTESCGGREVERSRGRHVVVERLARREGPSALSRGISDWLGSLDSLSSLGSLGSLGSLSRPPHREISSGYRSLLPANSGLDCG